MIKMQKDIIWSWGYSWRKKEK